MPTYTTAQYQALSAAIALGALEVEYADKKVKYRSLNEMLQIQHAMALDLGLYNRGNGGRVKAEFNSDL